MRRPPAGMLIHGLGGIGKTTLARGFVQWLADTGGLHAPPLWFTFNDIHSSEHVINQMVAGLFGTAAMAADMAQKLAALTQVLRDQPYLIVWDNFESVSGIPGTEVHPLLPEPDRQQLRDFLYTLRGGKTKVIITSRSPDGVDHRTHCYRLPLGGLQGEERLDILRRHCARPRPDHKPYRSAPRRSDELPRWPSSGHACHAHATGGAQRRRTRRALTPPLAPGSDGRRTGETLCHPEVSSKKPCQRHSNHCWCHSPCIERFDNADYLEAMASIATASYSRTGY